MSLAPNTTGDVRRFLTRGLISTDIRNQVAVTLCLQDNTNSYGTANGTANGNEDGATVDADLPTQPKPKCPRKTATTEGFKANNGTNKVNARKLAKPSLKPKGTLERAAVEAEKQLMESVNGVFRGEAPFKIATANLLSHLLVKITNDSQVEEQPEPEGHAGGTIHLRSH